MTLPLLLSRQPRGLSVSHIDSPRHDRRSFKAAECFRRHLVAIRRHGAVTSETVAFLDTPLPDMGAAAAEAWGIHNWSPKR